MIEPPDAPGLAEAVEAIREADAIVIGPGSLYTSILPNLLVADLAKELFSSHAVKIFICNVMTQPGETDDYKVSDHLQAIQDHVGHQFFDYVLVNNGEIPEEVRLKYAEEGAQAVQLDLDEVSRRGYTVIADKLVLFRTFLRHDAEKLSQHIVGLVEGWMNKKR
jgi:uncharacterized cofD-like protein